MQEEKKAIFFDAEHMLEIVEFTLGDTIYGINVAKVREVVNVSPITPMPKTHPFIEGVFTLRGKVLPLVNLASCLQITDNDPKRIIIAELNKYQVGFLVDEVLKIQRVSWDQVSPAPEITQSNLIIGIIKIKDYVVILLDFENIFYSINPAFNQQLTNFKPLTEVEELKKRQEKTIMIVEDSPFLLDLTVKHLNNAGYNNIVVKHDGKEALIYLEEVKKDHENVLDAVQILITDLEMPCIDGKSLLKYIRDDEKLKVLPVIIFSSLLNPDEAKRDKNLGSTAQISKPKVDELIKAVNLYIK